MVDIGGTDVKLANSNNVLPHSINRATTETTPIVAKLPSKETENRAHLQATQGQQIIKKPMAPPRFIGDENDADSLFGDGSSPSSSNSVKNSNIPIPVAPPPPSHPVPASTPNARLEPPDFRAELERRLAGGQPAKISTTAPEERKAPNKRPTIEGNFFANMLI